MKWNIDKGKPICPQIEDQICAGIALGEFAPGEKLQSVREMAVEAGVNPNTVQKAFSELERDGLIFSRLGSGWYIGEKPDLAREKLRVLINERTDRYLKEMRLLGADRTRVIEIIKEREDE